MVRFNLALVAIFFGFSFTACVSKPTTTTRFDRAPAATVNLKYKVDQIDGLNFEYLEVEGLEYRKQIVRDKNLVLVVHASDLTDPNRLLKANLQTLSHATAERGFHQFQLAMEDERNAGKSDIYPLPSSAIFAFEGDSHRISHVGDVLILAGGNLTRCLCTALQSYLALARPPNNQSIIYLPTDSIYEGFFNDPKADKANQQVLSNLTDAMSDTQFSQFVIDRFIGERVELCPDYEPIRFIKNPTRQFSFVIERAERVVGVKGEGPFKVRLVFVSTKELLQFRDL